VSDFGEVEVRTLLDGVRADRASTTDPPRLTGHAIRTGIRSQDLGGFVELVSPQGLTRALERSQDLVALANHDAGRVLGRRSAKTLTVEQDAQGLRFELIPPAHEAGLIESIARGDCPGTSFAFRKLQDQWDETTTPPTRTLLDFELREVSLGIAFPAYIETTVALRSLAAARKESAMATAAVPVAPVVDPVPPIAPSLDREYEREVRKFSLRALLAGAAGLPNVEWGREKEVSAELARRAGRPFSGYAVPMAVLEHRVLTTALPAGGPGSNLIATDHRADLYIDQLRAALKIKALGARVLSGLAGNVEVPKLKASATAGWVAENTALTISDPAFEKITLVPKHVGCLAEYSRNLLLQSSPDIEELLRDDFAKVLAEAVDLAAIAGTGGTQPTGILQTAGIGTATGGATWATVIELIAAVEAANVTGTGFLTNSAVVAALRKASKVATTDSVMVMEGPNTLAGYPVAVSNLVPAQTIIFGAWTDLFLAYWSELDLLVNPYESVAYSKGNVQLRGFISMDVAVRHPQSFAAASDLVVTVATNQKKAKP
jgi:HK97 family phage major capsid protein/HK97 family phage prohead protease